MHTEDEIGAKADYVDSLRDELREKLLNDDKVFFGNRHIDYSDVLEQMDDTYYQHATAFMASKLGSNTANRIEKILDRMAEEALQRTIDIFINDYAEQQIKEAKNDY